MLAASITAPATSEQGEHHLAEIADAYVRGYVEGHEQGTAEGTAITGTVRQLLADAWAAGYDTGNRDGHAETRADTAQIITDLAVSHAEIADAWEHFGRTTREQRIAADMAQMQDNARRLHEQIGTSEWAGLDNAAQLPPAHWEPSPGHLADLKTKADQALALAPHPVLTNWADVYTYVNGPAWNRILRDLQPGGQRDRAIDQANRTNRNGTA